MRLVDADDLDEKGIEFSDTNVYVPIEAIWNAPTIEAEPVRHGEWLPDEEFSLNRICSNCKKKIWVPMYYGGYLFNYCPNCGAKMKVGGQNE